MDKHDNERLVVPQTTEFYWDVFPVRIEYKEMGGMIIINGRARQGGDYVIEQAKPAHKRYRPLKHPNLFVKFAGIKTREVHPDFECPDFEELKDFIETWGPLGLFNGDRREVEDKIYAGYMPELAEPLKYEAEEMEQVADFLVNFKRAYKNIERLHEKNDPHRARQVAKFLTLEMRYTTTQFISIDEKTGKPKRLIMPLVLAGALLLQLYNYWVSGKKLTKCNLPSCNQFTTRPKFCSDLHKSEYFMRRGRFKDNPDYYLKHFPHELDALFTPEELEKHFGIQ